MEPADARPDLRFTFGAIEIGMVLAVFLTGIATLQVWNYFRDYPDDSRPIKLLVVGVYLGDTVHSLLLVHAVYMYTIIDFAEYAALQYLTRSMSVSVLMTGLIALTVQSYYCMRVKRITHSWAIAGGCWTLALVREVFALIISATAIRVERYDVFETPGMRWKMIAMLSIGAASDLLIAAFICGGILRMRSGMPASDKVVDRIVAFTIASGLLTSIVAVVEMVTYLALRNFIFITFYCITAKLFANSLFASLNERNHNKKDLDAWTTKRTSASSTRMAFERQETAVTVELTTVQEQFADPDRSRTTFDKVHHDLKAV